MNIGLDMDGVVYDFHHAVYTYCKVYEGFEGSYTEFWKDRWWSFSKEEQRYLVSLEPFYMARPLSDTKLEILDKLAGLGNLYYITAREKSLELVTEKFMRKNKVPQGQNLIFSKEKASYAKLLKLDYFVDDFASYVRSIRKPTIAFLMAQVWNRDDQGVLPTIYSLRELYEIVSKEKKVLKGTSSLELL